MQLDFSMMQVCKSVFVVLFIVSVCLCEILLSIFPGVSKLTCYCLFDRGQGTIRYLNKKKRKDTNKKVLYNTV